jgi:hypothetical protein
MGKQHLIKEKEEIQFLDLVQGMVKVDKDIIDELRVDARGIVPSYSSTWKEIVKKERDDEVIIDGLGAKWFRPPGCHYFDQKEGSFPLAAMTSAAEIEDYDWPNLADPERLRGLREKIEALGEDYAITIGCPVGGIFALGFRMRGYLNFYLDLAGNPSFACSLMDKFTESEINYWDVVLSEVADLVDIIVYEDD